MGANWWSPEMVVPAGFRFHPSNEELIKYLRPKNNIAGVKDPNVDIWIPTVDDVCDFNPSELTSLCWRHWNREYCYFFCKWKSYGKGKQRVRKTKTGKWKKTGKELPINDRCTRECIGMRSILVFYDNRKTNYVMHVYEMNDHISHSDQSTPYVICRLQIDSNKKKNTKNKVNTLSNIESTITFDLEIPGESLVITRDNNGLGEGNPEWISQSQDLFFHDVGETSVNTTSYSDISQMVYGQARADLESSDSTESQHNDYKEMHDPNGYIDLKYVPKMGNCIVSNNYGQPTSIESVTLKIPATTQGVSSHAVVDDISSLAQPLYSPDSSNMMSYLNPSNESNENRWDWMH